jgi:hypothetical protein
MFNAIATWIAAPVVTKESLETIKASVALGWLDSSCHGMWYTYNMSLKRQFTIKGPVGTGKELGQCYTHAFLGTHKEDLSLVQCKGSIFVSFSNW